MYTVSDDARTIPVLRDEERVTRRQDAPNTYVLNGAVYVARTDWLRKTESFIADETVAYVMPPAHSIDVDSELDLALCSLLLTQSPPSSNDVKMV